LSWRWLGWWLLLLCMPLCAKETLTIGVLAVRGEAKTSAQWQPLALYLNAAVPEYAVAVKALDLLHLREAVRQSQVDLVITEPAEYVRMTHESGLSSPLATLLTSYQGKPVRVLGGTILAQAGSGDWRSLADLSGKSVAVSSRDMFAGYQVQAYALRQAQVDVGPLVEVGMSQDAAVEALLTGKTQLAFVRSGLLESLVQEGRVDATQLKVVNPQRFPGYPFAVSTALYPEWPVVALSHLRDDTAARLAGALLSLPYDGAVAQQIGIKGFSVPADYEPVRALMRHMRFAPFDAEARVSLQEVWQEYRALIVVVMASVLAVLLLAIRSTLLSHKLRDLNDTLESRISQRTTELAKRNDDLAQTLNQLNLTRDELVESAKLAALGSMVAGLAHELNTPIGNGLTVASTLDGRTREFKKELDAGLRRSKLDAFVADAAQACDILLRSLGKAATLVTSFKQVAVDQTSAQRRKFSLMATLSEVILTQGPSLKQSGCQVCLPETVTDVELDSYPGPLGQVMTSLISNAMLHGYRDRQCGEIRVLVAPCKDAVRIDVVDDGVGIASSELPRIFEPFFTTQLGKGGSGLGLSIARNLVVGPLGGKINVVSNVGQGTAFTLTLPLVAPVAN